MLNLLLNNKLGRIIAHLIMWKKGFESWQKCKAGIKREFKPYITLAKS